MVSPHEYVNVCTCKSGRVITVIWQCQITPFVSSVEPNFVSMYEIGNYVYVFFREVAIEYINCGKVS